MRVAVSCATALLRGCMIPLTGLSMLLLWSGPVAAHSPFVGDAQEQLAAGLSLLAIVWLWGLYLWGQRRAPADHWRFWLFQATVVLLLLTVLGPLDDWAEESSAAHMAQHMMMMVVIAPLLVLCRPLPQYFAASGARGRSVWQAAFAITRYPMLCAWLHAAVIWFWHIPVFYMAALENPWVHFFEHACFMVTALWFWWAVLHGSARNTHNALLALLFTLMHTGFLGAFLTFSGEPWYPREARSLADQQLAGLLMWVMGGIPYIVGAFLVGIRLSRRLE